MGRLDRKGCATCVQRSNAWSELGRVSVKDRSGTSTTAPKEIGNHGFGRYETTGNVQGLAQVDRKIMPSTQQAQASRDNLPECCKAVRVVQVDRTTHTRCQHALGRSDDAR
eukprot:4994848-Pleurochrysis_carterae.AAC.1